LAFEVPVAHGRDDLELWCESAQRNFESHLIIASCRATMRDAPGAKFACHASDNLRLHHALCAN